MSYWQVHVTFDNGAVMTFGVQADGPDPVLAIAGERIPPCGTVRELEVVPLDAAVER